MLRSLVKPLVQKSFSGYSTEDYNHRSTYMRKKNDLQLALASLSADRRKAVATKLGMTPEALRVAAYGVRSSGKPNLSPERAAKLEKLIGLPREKACVACSKCDILKSWRG